MRIAKDMNWIRNVAPTLVNFWKDVVKYREIGLDTHPEYIKRIEREKLREERKAMKEKWDNSNITQETPKKKCLIID